MINNKDISKKIKFLITFSISLYTNDKKSFDNKIYICIMKLLENNLITNFIKYQKWNMDKSKVELLFDSLETNEISDIHILEWKKIYVRDSSGDVIPTKWNIIEKDEIIKFIKQVLSEQQIKKLEKHEEIDSSFSRNNNHFRINVYITRWKYAIAIRKISANIPTLEEIDIPDYIQDFLKKDKWLILITWPTGSGKSTTLSAMVNYINKTRKKHIITLEDPIEFIFEDEKCLVTQREIGKDTEWWDKAIKSAVRQDPDIIMVWEMRDPETIETVLNLVETGHLVLSTLHTVNAAQTISRIIDVFPGDKQKDIAVKLSLSLEIAISQRLIPLKNKNGRIVIRDIMINTPAIKNNIKNKEIEKMIAIIETGAKYGMKTMDRSLAEVVAKNLVNLEDVKPLIQNKEYFINSLKNLQNG